MNSGTHRLGYAYMDFLFYETQNKIFILEKNCGLLHIYNLPDFSLQKQINLFNLEAVSEKMEPTFEYIKTFDTHFKKKVSDFIVKDGKAYLLTEDGNNRYLSAISIDFPNQQQQLFIARKFNNIEIGSCYFVETTKGYQVASIIQNNQDSFFYLSEENPL